MDLDSGAPRWLARRENLIWKTWDGERFVVYHCLSGDTHVLNHLPALVLRQLEAGPGSVAELATQLADAVPGCEQEEFRNQLAQIVGFFDKLGLIEPAP